MQAVVDSELSAIDFFLSQRCESPSSLDDPGLKQRHEMLKFARFRACFSVSPSPVLTSSVPLTP
eukprot:scaffold1490_cov162-Ochromonas_danica.AAC.21